MDKWRLYCEDEGCLVYCNSEEAPTQCPNDVNHTIRSDSQVSLGAAFLSVTARQIRLALIANAISLASIDTALDTLEEPTKSLAKIEWEYAGSFDRNNPLVETVGQLLEFTSSQLDDLWVYAGTL